MISDPNQRPPAAPLDRLAPHPDHIGPYRILQVLGEGGMGIVYEAEQTTPVHRRVAIKVMRAGTETREVVARFEAERQALAVMTHESIAKVLDAGASEAGRPFVVMELVRGVPITDYSDGHKLSTRERIDLFIPICKAVQHAHQKGVIHRDLKPSNVLVTEVDGKALPKVIDFGIAKATGQRLTEKTLVTMVGQAVGTPAYMSPEQAEMSGLDIDTRTDIYSLGVMLYEVLVGRLPEDPQELGMHGFMVRLAMGQTDPARPSAKVGALVHDKQALAALRGTSADGLYRELRGDLDWIVMKAMDKDRSRRYETANGLALDLGRYLADQPVEARPPTTTYRMRKFIKRHKRAAAAITAVGLALIVGATAATIGFIRATRAEASARNEAATARQVSDFLVNLFAVSDPDTSLGAPVTAREILDSGAKKIETDLSGQPLVQARLMNTMGDVYLRLGLYREAERLLTRALGIRTQLLGGNAAEVGDNLITLGALYRSQGRYAEADTTLLRAARLLEDTRGGDDPAAVEGISQRAGLYREQGRYGQADSLTREVIARMERSLGADRPEIADELGGLAISQAEQGRPASAESLFRQVLSIRERTVGLNHPASGRALSNLASSLLEQGKLAEAKPLYERGLATDTKVYGTTHPQVAMDLYNLGNVHNESDPPRAIDLYQQAQDIWEKSFGSDHPYVAAALTSRANAYTIMKRYEEAVTLLRRALLIREKTLAAGHPFIGTTHHVLGVATRELGRVAESEEHLRRALEIRQQSLEPSSYYTAETFQELGLLYQSAGRSKEAEQVYQRAITQWDTSGRPQDEAWTELVGVYAKRLRQQGRDDEAAALGAKSAPQRK